MKVSTHSSLLSHVCLYGLTFKTLSVTTMAGPPALDEEELSSEDEDSEEQEGDDYEGGGDEGEEVNVGLGGLDMRERNSDEENHTSVSLRRNGGKRSGEEYMSGEAETEEEDFSSPPAKVVTPSKRRVVVSESQIR